MTTQEKEFGKYLNESDKKAPEFLNLKSILPSFTFNDFAFESLLTVINDRDAFLTKLYELMELKIIEGFIPLMYEACMEEFKTWAESYPAAITIPQELMAIRFADRIKEAIKQYTPEYYNFTCEINYYDYRLLPILTNGCNNHREIIETVLRDKAVRLVSDFIYSVLPEIESVLEKLDDETLTFIIPSILEYNRTTIADKEVVMYMMLHPEKLFPLKTENYETADVIIQSLLEHLDKKRIEDSVSSHENNT